MADKRVLSVGVEDESLSAVSGHLEQAEYAVENAPTPRSASTMLVGVHFDLVILAHPQVGLDLQRFLAEIRHTTSESKGAKVLVLAANPGHAELQGLHERRLEILSHDQALVGDLAAKVLAGDPRMRIAAMVRLKADLPYGKSLRICQSENLSISGMLVRTNDTLPIDTKVFVDFKLPDGKDSVQTRARVVRLTGPGEIPGIALEFQDLSEETRSRLHSFLMWGAS